MRRLALRSVLCVFAFAGPGLADVIATEQSGETPVAVEVVGRVVVEWTDRALLDDGSERSSGTVLDELGQPVSATLVVAAPDGARLLPCARGPQEPGPRLQTSHDGRFCFVSASTGPNLELRVEAEHYEPASVTAPRASALGPRILRAPRSVELDSPTSATFEVLPTPSSYAGHVRLFAECGGAPALLHEAPSERGLVRAEVEPPRIPGPGACTVFAEQTSNAPATLGGDGGARVLRSRSHQLLAVAKATLELETTSLEQGATVVSVAITAGPARKKLDAGVIEVWQGDAFVASAPIDRGATTVSIPHGRKPAVARISLADGGPGVIGGASLELPISSVAQRTSRSALVGWMVFGALGVWLVWLWLGRGRRASVRAGDRDLGPGVAFGAPAPNDHDQRIRGRVTDASTGEPLAAVRVLLEAPEVASVRLVAETLTTKDGTFCFDERLDRAALRRLRFECDGYVMQEGRITSARVAARMMSLRHALLGALVTRGQGVTKHGARVTPSELARIAAHHGNSRLSAWALAIERAVYGPRPPSHERAQLLLAGDDPSDGESRVAPGVHDAASSGAPSVKPAE